MTSRERRARANFPHATYRIQLNQHFTFADAERVVPHLAALGVTHLYVSPILKARPGSMHGYDVTDHSVLNPEIGTRADFDQLVVTLHAHGLGLIVDIVPNHQSVMGDDGPWWLDLLENGPASEHATFFDVDWNPVRASMRDRILVPVLGEPYGAILEKGELKLTFDPAVGEFSVRYHEHRLPVDPREYPRIFARHKVALERALAHDEANRADFESLLGAFARLPASSAAGPAERAERYRDKEVHKRRLVRLLERCPALAQYIEDTLQVLNGSPGDTGSFDALHALLEAQPYRLAYWRVAVDEINYRRFFDVNTLAALRMNEPAVFEQTHRLIFELLEAGQIDGLRIDHPDGLYDPQEYFERLQQRAGASAPEQKPLYVAVEKILAAHERLPAPWTVHGTTGYEFAALITGWLVAAHAEPRFNRIYREFTGQQTDFETLVYRSKKLVMRASLAAEVAVLAIQLDRIAQLDRHTADFTQRALREAIEEVIASFPVYRTYVSVRGVGEDDRRSVEWAVNVARKRSFAADLSVFDFLRAVLLGELEQERPDSHHRAAREFAMKFQQVTAPVTAKGVEDTAFYRYNRLVCLNEVGSDPGRFGYSTAALHQANLERARQWPWSMLASSTHDTKRSEDVRARIAVLSELPEQWRKHLGRWSRLNRGKRRSLESGPAPTRNDEYLLYQVLLGTWPPTPDRARYIERLQAYMLKAARESKSVTAWMNPNEEYEQALSDFVAAILAGESAFERDLVALARSVAFFGYLNSLSQTVLKLTVPGVPDFYQGTEVLDLSLVDPDNRRPVDYSRIQQMQQQASTQPLPQLLRASVQEWADETAPILPAGVEKLALIVRLLELRRSQPELFLAGGYEALRVAGPYAEHVCAFIRRHEAAVCVVVVPRWMATLTHGELRLPLGEVWEDTRIELEEANVSGVLNDVLTGSEIDFSASRIHIADVLREFPLAVFSPRAS